MSCTDKLSNTANAVFEKMERAQSPKNFIDIITIDFSDLSTDDKIALLRKENISFDKTSELQLLSENLKTLIDDLDNPETSVEEKEIIGVLPCMLSEYISAFAQSEYTTPALNSIATVLGKLSEDDYKKTSTFLGTLQSAIETTLQTKTSASPTKDSFKP